MHRVIALALPVKMSALQSALSAAWLADEAAQNKTSAASSTTITTARATDITSASIPAGIDTPASEGPVSNPQAATGQPVPSDARRKEVEEEEEGDGLRFVPLENPFGDSHTWDSPLMPREVAACRSEHAGVVDSFAPIVWAEFTALMTAAAHATQSGLWFNAKAIAHVPLFLACFLAPWRLAELLVALFEPRRRYRARQLRRLVGRLERAEGALALYRAQLLPFCNRAAKLAVDRMTRVEDTEEKQQRQSSEIEVISSVFVALRDTWRAFVNNNQENDSNHNSSRSRSSSSSSRRNYFVLPPFCAQWLESAETKDLAWFREEIGGVATKVAKLNEEGEIEKEVSRSSTGVRHNGSSKSTSAFRKLIQGFATTLDTYSMASDRRLYGEATKLLTQVYKHCNQWFCLLCDRP